MGQENYSQTCECGNSIVINTYHHTGGVNDNDKVTLKCTQCGKTTETVIKNIESAKVSGAIIVN